MTRPSIITRTVAPLSLICLGLLAGCGGSSASRTDFDDPLLALLGECAAGSTTTPVAIADEATWRNVDLVEVLSIGVDRGDDPYMLGRIEAVALDEDSVFVLDGAAARVRVFDRAGVFRFEFGGAGQGPGEFDQAVDMTLASDGRIYVSDLYKIHVFTREGEHVRTIGQSRRTVGAAASANGTVWFGTRTSNFIGERGIVNSVLLGASTDSRPSCVVPVSKSPPPTLVVPASSNVSRQLLRVPLWPSPVWAFAPDGTLLVADAESGDLFVYGPDLEREATRLRLRRATSRVQILDEERSWWERFTFSRAYRSVPEWQWDGPPIPEFQPLVTDVFADTQGRVWILAPNRPSSFVPGCTDDFGEDNVGATLIPCWERSYGLEVLGLDGTYYGEIDLPEGLHRRARPSVWGDFLVFAVEDAAGVQRVKVFRIVAVP